MKNAVIKIPIYIALDSIALTGYTFAIYCQVGDDSVVYIDDHLINSDTFE